MRLAHMDGVIARALQHLREGERVHEGHRHVVRHRALGGVVRHIRLVILPILVLAPRRLAVTLRRRPRRLQAVRRPARRVQPLAGRREAVRLVHPQRPIRHPMARRVHPAHQRAPRRRAHRARIGIRKDHPLRRQTLHVRRTPHVLVRVSLVLPVAVTLVQARHHRPAITVIKGHRGVLPAHVVHHEEDDVRLLPGSRPADAIPARRRPLPHQRTHRQRPRAKPQHPQKTAPRNHRPPPFRNPAKNKGAGDLAAPRPTQTRVRALTPRGGAAPRPPRPAPATPTPSARATRPPP